MSLILSPVALLVRGRRVAATLGGLIRIGRPSSSSALSLTASPPISRPDLIWRPDDGTLLRAAGVVPDGPNR
jgi:hypothetical protein